MKHSSLSDDEIRRLLDSVTTDDSIKMPNKEALRHRMVDELRRAPSSGTSQPSDQTVDDPVVVELSIEVLDEKRSIPWRRISLGAAALVLAVVGVVNVLERASNETADQVATENGPSATLPLGARGPLDPGQHSSDFVAGGIEFATSSSVVVTQSEPDLIVLGPVGADSAASLSIMSADRSLEEVLEGHRQAGLIRLARAGAESPNGAITEFEVRLQTGASSEDCEPAGACLTIGRVTVGSGSVVKVREFLGPDGGRLWALYQSDQYLDPFQREANLIQESLQITPGS